MPAASAGVAFTISGHGLATLNCEAGAMTSAFHNLTQRADHRPTRAETAMWLGIWLLIIAISAYLIIPATKSTEIADSPATSVVAAATTPIVPTAAPVAAPRPALVAPVLRDEHYSGCRAARAAGRYNIPSWDPSYREWMDGDGDGLACEPYPR